MCVCLSRVTVQIMCSYITLPLYALVTQVSIHISLSLSLYIYIYICRMTWLILEMHQNLICM